MLADIWPNRFVQHTSSKALLATLFVKNQEKEILVLEMQNTTLQKLYLNINLTSSALEIAESDATPIDFIETTLRSDDTVLQIIRWSY